MKIVLKIAIAELKKMFFSPVAWLVLLVFMLQASVSFSDYFANMVKGQATGATWRRITYAVYCDDFGLYPKILQYLYLYIPLLTMGLMSREFSTGSIKLLYSSPITNRQIITGKFLAIAFVGFILTAIVGIYTLVGVFSIEHADVPLLLCALLGIYLQILAYGAIGLFMSTLTSYIVIAAIGTLAIFSFLAYIGTTWQDVDFVRDLTYWISLSGRVFTFIRGMITSEDVLYFLIIIVMFLSLTVVRLNNVRQKTTGWVGASKYVLPIVIACMVGYFSSLPAFKGYLDVTRDKKNTITKNSQEIFGKIPHNITITTYANMLDQMNVFGLPQAYKSNFSRLERYIRFDPTIRLKYVRYYHRADFPYLEEYYPKLNDDQRIDTLKIVNEWKFKIPPYRDIKPAIDLAKEDFRTVSVLTTPEGKSTALRFFGDYMIVPNEGEVSAAFRRLIEETPCVGFLSGHGEPAIDDKSERGYSRFSQEKTFRYSLINQGFDVKNVSLENNIPDNIQILVIAGIKRHLSLPEQAIIKDYVARGGNLFILGKPGTQEYMNDVTGTIGVKFLPGQVVHPFDNSKQSLILPQITEQGRGFNYWIENIVAAQNKVVFTSSCALQVADSGSFTVQHLLTTAGDSSWTEIETRDFSNDTARFNPAAGEVRKRLPLMVSLDRMVNKKHQKIIVAGDADWLTTGELGTSRANIASGNYNLLNGVLFNLTDGYSPLDVRQAEPIDNRITISREKWATLAILLKWVLPALLLITGSVIWIRRKRK